MNSKYIPQKQAPIMGIPLTVEIKNPKRKSIHKAPCLMPMDCINMDLKTFTKSYGPHIIKAVHDLLQHGSFRIGLEKPKSSLILSP